MLDTEFETIAIIDSYKSLIWTDRYNGYGDFELYTPLDLNTLSYLDVDNYLWIKESEHIMIVEEVRIQSDVEEGKVMIVKGRSLESILDRRIIWSRISVTDMDAGQIIERILNENVIEPTDENRKIPYFAYVAAEDIEMPEKLSSYQRFGDSVYDAVCEICEAYALGWKIVYYEGWLVFVLYSGLNRTYSQNTNPWVTFSPKFENLIDSDYTVDKTYLKTITLVAGQGEGDERKTTVVNGYPDEELTGMDRRELFTDARDISDYDDDGGTISDTAYTKLLTTRGEEKLAEQIATSEFSGQAETTWMFRYGEDFGMGDVVQVANEFGMEAEARVTEFIMSNSETGFEAYPTFALVDGYSSDDDEEEEVT